MKLEKILAVAAVAIVAGQAPQASAATAAVCAGGTAGSVALYGGSGVPVTGGVGFIRTGFNVMCSNNVFMQYNEVSANLFAVAAGSAKGNQSVRGNSNGGAITVHGVCTGTNQACSATDVGTALTAAAST